MSRANPATTHGNAGIAAWSFKLRGKVTSYAEAETFMREHGSDGFAKLGPHMALVHEGHDSDPGGRAGRTYAVELYSTKIVRYYPDGAFSVDNGGWNTPTTTARIGAVTPDGFVPYHHKKLLGLWCSRLEIGHAANGVQILWPLDHSRRIDPATGDAKEN